MTKEGKHHTSLPTISILVGRCWLRKYTRTYKALEAHVHEKYNSKVEIVSRMKKQSSFVKVHSGCGFQA